MTRLLQGRIRILLEQHDDARRLLESAREDLLSLGMPFEAATASLELADCYLRMSATPRWDQIESLARQALELLSSVPEAAKVCDAWRLLIRAIGARSLDAAQRQLRSARLHAVERNRP